MRDSCKGCVYCRPLWTTTSCKYLACHYLLDTGEKRPCPAENCTVKKTKKGMQEKKKGAGYGKLEVAGD